MYHLSGLRHWPNRVLIVLAHFEPLGCFWTYSCVEEHQFILNHDQCLAFILCLRMLRHCRDLTTTPCASLQGALCSMVSPSSLSHTLQLPFTHLHQLRQHLFYSLLFFSPSCISYYHKCHNGEIHNLDNSSRPRS